MSTMVRLLRTGIIIAVWVCASGVRAQELTRSPASDVPRPGVVRTPVPLWEAQGFPLRLVFYDLRGTSGVTGGDAVARKKIERAFTLQQGMVFNVMTTQAAIQRVLALDFVRSASYQVYGSEFAGHVVLAVTVELGPKGREPGPKGVVTGALSDFPILYQDESTLLRLQLNGGFGFYNDFNPWFGNAQAFTGRSPIAEDPADGPVATWYEMSAEYGIAGIRHLDNSPLWIYGAGSLLTSFSAGQDLFRADTRAMTRLEELYGGMVIGDPQSDWSANLSFGRQDWQLNDGFLFSRFAAGANAGPYPSLYLNPRTAFQMTMLADIKWKHVRLQGFYLDPAEIDYLDSNSTYAGANLSYTLPDGFEVSALYYQAPESNTVFQNGTYGTVPRKGLQTVNGRIGTTNLFGWKGVELFGEYAWQTHRDADVNAHAYYARAGYTFTFLPWSPNLSYRYASFSGDDPNTPTYERFDAQLSSGLDTWVQGVNSKKVVSNSNLNSHRIRLNLGISMTLALTFDYFWLFADEVSSGSSAYAQELNGAVRWAITPNFFFLGVAGTAFPKDNLVQQAGSDLKNWSTVQASLFWFL